MAEREKLVVAKASVINAGDLLISDSILESGHKPDGTYDFSYIFKNVKPYIKEADYAVINLETCISTDKNYCGFPKFRTPDTIIAAAKDAGFRMFLTASNHSYDLGTEGVKCKIDWLENYGVDYIGTRKSDKENFSRIVDVNGIRIGMLNFTKTARASRRFITIMNAARNRKTNRKEYVFAGKEARKMIAMYRERRIDLFAETLRQEIDKLREQGADIIAAYPHWGTEYLVGVDEMQDELARLMCDYGVDVIIGGHPHVVEPVRVYTSEKSGKTTVCIHSLGNFVSSMRAVASKENAEYTEDGALFIYDAEKYSDGTAAVTHVDVLPVWVKKTSGKKEYTVIPLEKGADWKEKYDIANFSKKVSSGYQSRQRTRKIVSRGLKKFNEMHEE